MEYFFHIVLNFVQTHTYFAYTILFLGAVLDTLIPVSFFVYGEVFFLVGSILSGIGVLNIFITSFVLICGGICGDNMSYYIGKNYGSFLIDKLKKNRFFSKFFSEEQQKKYEHILLHSGGIILFFSRVGGPFAWIMPFLAGSFKLPYKTFLLFNTPGIFVGIGTFLFVGYFLGVNIPLIKQIFSIYFPLLSLACIFLFLVLFFVRKFFSQYLSKGESSK